MYDVNLTGPYIGIVIGNEGSGVSEDLLRKMRLCCGSSWPHERDIDPLNASVAARVLAYEVLRQKTWKR